MLVINDPTPTRISMYEDITIPCQVCRRMFTVRGFVAGMDTIIDSDICPECQSRAV